MVSDFPIRDDEDSLCASVILELCAIELSAIEDCRTLLLNDEIRTLACGPVTSGLPAESFRVPAFFGPRVVLYSLKLSTT